MISDYIHEFFKKNIFIHVGTRNGNMQPNEVMAWGINDGSDRKTLTIFIPKAAIEKTLVNLQNNSKIAVTCVEPFAHESYQFKGNYISHRPCTAEETSYQDSFISGFNTFFQAAHMPHDFLSRLNYKQSVAVTFNVEDIFVQTPGPGAGKKIN